MKIGNLEVYGIIYKITNTVNGKVYIGQTTDKRGFDGRYKTRGEGIERVYKYHKRFKNLEYSYNRHLLESIKKYGFDVFKVDKIFDIAFTKDELNIKEICWVAYYNSYRKGYNQSLGGESGSKGVKWTEEQKEIKRKQNRGKNNPFYGKTHSNETKIKISKASKNRIHTEESKEKVSKTLKDKYKYDKNFKNKMKMIYENRKDMPLKKTNRRITWKYIICEDKKFNTIKECATYLNINDTVLGSWINGKIPMSHKYYSKKISIEGEFYKVKPDLKTIYCEGIYFDNAQQVSNYYGISKTTVLDWLNGKVEMDKEFYDKDLKYVYRENKRIRRVDKAKHGNEILCEDKLFNSIRLCADYYNIKKTTMRAWLNGQNPMPSEWLHKGLRYNECIEKNKLLIHNENLGQAI